MKDSIRGKEKGKKLNITPKPQAKKMFSGFNVANFKGLS